MVRKIHTNSHMELDSAGAANDNPVPIAISCPFPPDLLDVESTPALEALVGQPVGGRRGLQVTDRFARDVGTCDGWTVGVAL
jgi:hypothetical protein